MTEPAAPIIVCLSLDELDTLAEAVSALDGLKGYTLDPDYLPTCNLVERAHTIIERAAGQYAGEIYAEDDGSAAEQVTA